MSRINDDLRWDQDDGLIWLHDCALMWSVWNEQRIPSLSITSLQMHPQVGPAHYASPVRTRKRSEMARLIEPVSCL